MNDNEKFVMPRGGPLSGAELRLAEALVHHLSVAEDEMAIKDARFILIEALVRASQRFVAERELTIDQENAIRLIVEVELENAFNRAGFGVVDRPGAA